MRIVHYIYNGWNKFAILFKQIICHLFRIQFQFQQSVLFTPQHMSNTCNQIKQKQLVNKETSHP